MFGVASVGVGAEFDESARDFGMAAAGGHVQRSGSRRAAAGVDVGSGFDQDLDDSGAGGRCAAVGGAVERGVAAAVEQVGIGAVIQKQFDNFQRACGGGVVEEGPASIAAGGERRVRFD